MFYKALFAATAMCVFAGQGAQADPSPAEKFGTIAETWDAEISPDGSHLALGCSPKGVPAVCIYGLDSDAKPRLIPPPEGARITGIRWASEQYLLYSVNLFEKVEIDGGLEGISVRRLLSYDMKTGKTAFLMRNARSVTNTTNIDSILIDKPGKVQMAFTFLKGDETRSNSRLNNEGELKHIIYEVDLKSGKAKVKDTLQRSVLGGVHDASGRRYAEILMDTKKNVFKLDSLLGKRKTVFESRDADIQPFYVEGIAPGGEHLIVNFDDGDRFGLHEISLIDGQITPFKIDQNIAGNVGLIEDPYTGQILAYRFTDHLPQRIYIDDQFARVAADAKKALGSDSVILLSWTQDRNMFVVSSVKQGEPREYFLYDYSAPSLSPIGAEAPWLEASALGKVSALTYSARDGLEIPAYLTLPPGKTKADGPFPLVLMPHGGPESRDDATFDWLAQSVAAQGYAVLQPNFRGSAGYGAAFRNAGHSEFGGKMVTDVLDGAAHLVSEGIAQQGGHCTMGWSYGGYSALMTALLDPAKTQCVISINGVTEPFDFVKGGSTISAYWEQYMGDFYRTGRSEKRAITPLSRAEEFTQPVLLIHGKEDTTVEHDQSRSLANKSDNIRLVSMPGDDHGMYNSASRRKVIEESLAFLAEHHPAK